MFKKTGQSIVVGSHGGKLVRLDGQQFVILAAPTRSGKGVGVVIPNWSTANRWWCWTSSRKTST